MPVTTTSTLAGCSIERYARLVSGEAIPGAHAFRDFPAVRGKPVEARMEFVLMPVS